MSKYKTIILPCGVVGTTNIMRWCNEHPDEKLNEATFFVSETDKRGLVASDVKYEDIDMLLHFNPFEGGWHGTDDLEGWDRIHPREEDALWYCRKGERIICITN